MNEREIIVKALKLEAEQKPNERIFMGFKSFTYKEFSSMLDNLRELDEETKLFIARYIESALKMFHENPEFKKRILQLAGKTKK